jgi:SAM-dependent methyltransferase
MDEPWYQRLFEDFAQGYDAEPFTQGTSGEVDFFERELEGNRSARILDIGCGTGRHAVELSRRGYWVTGIDLSEGQLRRAAQKAADAGVKVELVRHDARALEYDASFDLVLLVCEGAFPLMETDEGNYQILEGAARALRPGGKLILTTLNALYPLRSRAQAGEFSGTPGESKMYFDLLTLRAHSTVTITTDSGQALTVDANERYYLPSEIGWLLSSVGLRNISFFSCELGAFSREKALSWEDLEMLVLAEK